MQWSADKPHKLVVVGSNPTPVTSFSICVMDRHISWAYNSVGRVLPLQGRSRGFKSHQVHQYSCLPQLLIPTKYFYDIYFRTQPLNCGTPFGELAERFNALVLKTRGPYGDPWVRIPYSPPLFLVTYYKNHLSNKSSSNNQGF